MSLVVSLRVPDGIVVAADSLSTAQNLLELVTDNIELECPKCKHKISKPGIKVPPIPIPFSASSYTQKLFSINDEYAISSFGVGVVNNKSIYYHIKQFEDDKIGTLKDLSKKLIEYFESELLKDYPKYREEAPDNWYPIGFHLNGYEESNGEQIGVTYQVYVGKKSNAKRRAEIGCSIGGAMKVVQKLWQIGKEDPRLSFKYNLYTLQDAIELCEFFIGATSTFQRFANEVQTVGGSIDIALLTPFHGFQWIKRKPLMKILEDKNEKVNKVD